MAEVGWLKSVAGPGSWSRCLLGWRGPVRSGGSEVADARLRPWPAGAGGTQEWAGSLPNGCGHRTPDGFERLLNSSVWDADALCDDARAYVGERLGPGGVLILDHTGFIKKGTASARVGRPYTGTSGKSGKIDNCRIGDFAAYATSSGRALVDRELYLPKSWTSDRERCQAAKILDERGFATEGDWPGTSSAAASPRACPPLGSPRTRPTGRTGTSADYSNSSASVTSWRYPSHSRSSPWPGSGASISSSKMPQRMPGRSCPAVTGQRARGLTTGPRPGCPSTWFFPLPAADQGDDQGEYIPRT